MKITPTKKKRLSRQIIRVARELEALHILGEATVTRIHIAIGNLPPRPVCERTIYRDLCALEEAGFVERYKARTQTRTKSGAPKCVNLWRLATPAQLRDRLQIVGSLSNKQIDILRQKRPLAENPFPEGAAS